MLHFEEVVFRAKPLEDSVDAGKILIGSGKCAQLGTFSFGEASNQNLSKHDKLQFFQISTFLVVLSFCGSNILEETFMSSPSVTSLVFFQEHLSRKHLDSSNDSAESNACFGRRWGEFVIVARI